MIILLHFGISEMTWTAVPLCWLSSLISELSKLRHNQVDHFKYSDLKGLACAFIPDKASMEKITNDNFLVVLFIYCLFHKVNPQHLHYPLWHCNPRQSSFFVPRSMSYIVDNTIPFSLVFFLYSCDNSTK